MAPKQPPRTRTITRLTLTVERIEETLPPSSPCAARKTIVVEGQELRDQLDQLGWLAHARAAGQRKPSPITQAEVIATYERRALANKAPKPAVLTTCWERFENREGFASTKKLWLLLPGTGDGERRLLGLVDEVSELDAIETARRCGFEAQVSL